MDRKRIYAVVGVVVAVFGIGIVAGGLLGEAGIATGMDGSDVLVGAGIAVAGAGATLGLRHSPTEDVPATETVGRSN